MIVLFKMLLIYCRSCAFLNAYNCKGEVFRKDAPRVNVATFKVTVPHSRERQDLLAKASTAGKRYKATHGEHLNSDDFFIAAERTERLAETQILQKKKKAFDDARVREAKANKVIAELKANKGIDVYATMNGVRVSELKILVHWKLGVQTAVPATKQLLIIAWNEAKNNGPKNLPKAWTYQDEEELTRLETQEITLTETAVGKKAGELVSSLAAGIGHLSAEQIRGIKALLPASPESTSGET